MLVFTMKDLYLLSYVLFSLFKCFVNLIIFARENKLLVEVPILVEGKLIKASLLSNSKDRVDCGEIHWVVYGYNQQISNSV